MATAAEQSARKKRREEEAERRRLEELALQNRPEILSEGSVPGQEAGTVPPEAEDQMSNIDEIAASEAPYDDGYVEPDPSDFVNPLTEKSIEIEPVDEKELREQSQTARFASLGEAAYDESGGFPENDELGPAETPEDEAALQKKWKEEGVADQQTHEEGQAAAKTKQEEARSGAPLMKGGIAASAIERDAPHVKELEYREDRLRKLGSGMSRGEIAAADNPVWQQALAEKEAREAAELSIEEKAGIANKKTTAMDKAMRKAGHEVDRGITPTFINPDTGKEEGGAHYVPSKHDVINAYDDEGNIVGQKVVDKKGLPEDPDKPSPEEMKSRRDAYANKIREDAVAQKAERKRQAMIRTNDKHGIEQLDIRTAEGAATRLRDAEAAIRADESKSQRQKEVAIQKLKNKGALDVEDSRAGATMHGADAIKEASMYGSDADVERTQIGADSAETINKNTTDAAQIQLETEVKADETAARNLAATNAAAAKAQADVDKAKARVANAADVETQKREQAHLQLMQDNLLVAQAADAKAERKAKEASERRRIAEEERSQTSRQTAASREGEAQGKRDQALLDANNMSPEAVAARRDKALADAVKTRTINQAILDDESSTPGEQDAARRGIRDANRVLTGDDGSESNQIPAAESEEYLQNAAPMTYQHTVDLLVNVDDDDGDETAGGIAGNNTDSLNKLVAEIRENIKNGNIDVDELDSVGNIMKSRMDPAVRESYERLIRVRDGQDDRHVVGGMDSAAQREDMQNRYDQADDTVTYLEQLFRGENPTNVAPFVPATEAATEGARENRRRLEDVASPYGIN
jgi:hypothetical protein